jgi:hypothetical protein
MSVFKTLLRLITAYWNWAKARRTTWGKRFAFGVPMVLVLLIVLGVIGSVTGGNKNTEEVTAPEATKTVKPTNTPKIVATNTPKTAATAEPTVVATSTTATAEPTVVATSTTVPAPTETPVVLKTVSASNLLDVADLPAGYTVVTIGTLVNSGPGSVLADPSAYSACGPGPELSLDRGFEASESRGPFIGETLMAYPSVDAADKAMSDAASRVGDP